MKIKDLLIDSLLMPSEQIFLIYFTTSLILSGRIWDRTVQVIFFLNLFACRF